MKFQRNPGKSLEQPTADYDSSLFEVGKLEATDSKTVVENWRCSSAVIGYLR